MTTVESATAIRPLLTAQNDLNITEDSSQSDMSLATNTTMQTQDNYDTLGTPQVDISVSLDTAQQTRNNPAPLAILPPLEGPGSSSGLLVPRGRKGKNVIPECTTSLCRSAWMNKYDGFIDPPISDSKFKHLKLSQECFLLPLQLSRSMKALQNQFLHRLSSQ